MSTDPDVVADVPRSPKQVARLRRRRARARYWSEYRRHRSGIVGLLMLGFFVAMALAAPLIYPENPA